MAAESPPPQADHECSVADLARRCAEEMARFQRRQPHNPDPCYELLRRALTQQDEAAWAAIYGQYRRLVRGWLGHTPGDPELLANQAFERFWRAIPPDRFARFPTLDGLLAYLKRCTLSVAIDAHRKQERRLAWESALGQHEELATAGSQASPLERLVDQALGQQLYERVLANLSGPLERLVFRAAFEWDLKPREIAARWPDLFADAREVSRIKERILRRLRRDGELRALWERPGGDGGET